MSILEKFRNRSFKRNKSNDKPREPETEIPLVSGRLRDDNNRQPISITEAANGSKTHSLSQEHRPYHHRRVKSSPADNRRVRTLTPAIWVAYNLGKIFPRYGHTVNVGRAKSEKIYLFGGNDGDQLLDDLYRIDPGTLSVVPLNASGNIPCALSMGASALVGNKFIVFGGLPNSSLVVDRGLYVFTTGSLNWSHVTFKGSDQWAPYGHTLNHIGSRLYVFGGVGQTIYNSRYVDCPLNDFISFDLLKLDKPDAGWESIETDQKPPERSGHICVPMSDTGPLVLFGGKGEDRCYNDVWIFNVIENTWTEAGVKGDTPAPRHGHAACVIENLIYVFGGETFEGVALDDLFAFNTDSQRWFSLNSQVSGCRPIARSGHAMSAFGLNIIVLGGKSSQDICGIENSVFVMDTSLFLFPPEAIPVTRDASLRKVLSEVPLQGVDLPLPSEPRSQVWSALPSTPTQVSTHFQSNPTQASTPASPVHIISQRQVRDQTTDTLLIELGSSGHDLIPPLSSSNLRKTSTLPSGISTRLSPTYAEPEAISSPVSMDAASQPWSTLSSHSSTPASPVPLPQIRNDTSKFPALLIESFEEEPLPPSLGYTPPYSMEDRDLLKFLSDECKALSRSFKIKSPAEPAADRESHFSRGANDNIEYQRDIDRGTNSDVFQMFHKTWHRVFARKIFRNYIIVQQRDLHKTVENEVRVLDKFRRNGVHENIITVLDYGWLDENKERFFVDLEACLLNLDDYIKENVKHILGLTKYFDTLPGRKSLRCLSFWGIVKDISSGLNYMHSIHELHRDVKPRNILLSDRGAWKITDFDFSMEGGSKLAYHTNSAHGTECYRAPELVSGTQAIVCMRSDIWALGCVIYELLSCTRAFPHEANVRAYYSDEEAKLDDPPLPSLSLQSKAYIRILLKHTLERRWWKRPTAGEILNLLSSLGSQESTEAYLEAKKEKGLSHRIGLYGDSESWESVVWKRYCALCKRIVIMAAINPQSDEDLKISPPYQCDCLDQAQQIVRWGFFVQGLNL